MELHGPLSRQETQSLAQPMILFGGPSKLSLLEVSLPELSCFFLSRSQNRRAEAFGVLVRLLRGSRARLGSGEQARSDGHGGREAVHVGAAEPHGDVGGLDVASVCCWAATQVSLPWKW